MKTRLMVLVALGALSAGACKKKEAPKVTVVDLRPEDKRPVGGGSGSGSGSDVEVPDGPKVLPKTSVAGRPAPAGAPTVDLEATSIGVGGDVVGSFADQLPTREGAFVWADAVTEALAKAGPGAAVIVSASADTPFVLIDLAAQGAAGANRTELSLLAAGAAGNTTLSVCAPADQGNCFGQALHAPIPGDFTLSLMGAGAASLGAFNQDRPAIMLGPLDAASLGQALGTLGAGSDVVIRIGASIPGVTAQDLANALAIDGGARKLQFIIGMPETPPKPDEGGMPKPPTP